ncbi:hypothetical protein DUNSADRAFT_14421 [Dunaliella salina]|uniref:Uncharacterized protein n=1 Tax=Dunaliella salina TaxID=3046 RepID=A0ABQ7H9H1_DUNSA|nr:hypothetical protein DUNSADRAFT_14421 [Dunaliella salina]|eukprot:KAF5843503.1 hypothetical protein DUNSADRAFT_14421 [Dunaliella salina]
MVPIFCTLRCDAVVLVREEEWANLRGDPLRQRDYVAYRMRYALEAAADSKKMAVREAAAAAAAAAPGVASATAATDAPGAFPQQRDGSLLHGSAGPKKAVVRAARGAAPGVPPADMQLDHQCGPVPLGAEQGALSGPRTPLHAAHHEHTLPAAALPMSHTPAPPHHPSFTGQASSVLSASNPPSFPVRNTVPSALGITTVHAPEHQASSEASAIHNSSSDPLSTVNISSTAPALLRAPALQATASSDTPQPLPDLHPASPLAPHTAGQLNSAPSSARALHVPMPPPPPSLLLKARPLRPEPPPHPPAGSASTEAAPSVLHTQSDQVRQMWPANTLLSTSAPPGSASPPSTHAVRLGVRAVPKKVTIKPRLAPVISGYTRTRLGYSIQWPDGSSSRGSSSSSSSSKSGRGRNSSIGSNSIGSDRNR